MKGKEFINQIHRAKMPDIEQVRANCHAQNAETPTKTRYVKPKRKILIAATAALMVTLMFSFNVFSITEIMQNLVFRGFNITRSDEIILPPVGDGEGYTTAHWTIENKDRSVMRYGQTWWKYMSAAEWVNVHSLAEAEQHLYFTPLELTYLPDNSERKELLLIQYPQGNFDIHNFIIYYMVYQDDGSPGIRFNLSAEYVGKNATVVMNTTDDFEKIILNNGIEALLMTDISMPYDIPIIIHTIMWIQDGVAYRIGGSFEIDEIIKMAESVG